MNLRNKFDDLPVGAAPVWRIRDAAIMAVFGLALLAITSAVWVDLMNCTTCAVML